MLPSAFEKSAGRGVREENERPDYLPTEKFTFRSEFVKHPLTKRPLNPKFKD